MFLQYLIHYYHQHEAFFKIMVVTIASAIGGQFFVGQAMPGQNNLLNQPAVIAGLVGGFVAICVKLMDVWWDARKAKREGQKKEVVSADKVAELSKSEREELRAGMKELHAREVAALKEQQARELAIIKEANARELIFVKEQLQLSKESEIEAREVAHSFATEIMRVQNFISKLLVVLPKEIEPPTFEWKDFGILREEAHQKALEKIEHAKQNAERIHTTQPS
jgi:Asp-tRNA(Asn)/Glu-tRNA(Gln) amidotransferase C subunit